MMKNFQHEYEILSFIDLQWFAAEEEGRTEDPTEQKIKQAREDGKIAKSSELNSALGMLIPLLLLVAISGGFIDTIMEMIAVFYTQIGDNKGIGRILATLFYRYYLRLTLPIMVVAFIAAFVSNLVQVGFLFTLKPIQPDFTKIVPNFGKYFKKTLFSAEAAFNLSKSIFKVIIAGTVAYLFVKQALPKLIHLSNLDVWRSFVFIAVLAVKIMISVGVIMLALAIPDYIFEKNKHKESLKMTKRDVLEEFKRSEGDPLVKSRIRQRMRELMSQNIVFSVQEADVLVTNPTHFAVALKFDNNTMIAPVVSAKGADEVAFQMRRIAREASIPIVENRPLARALYAEVEIGDLIPERFYQAVLTILTEIYRMNGKYREMMG